MKKQNAPGRQTPGEVLPKALLTLTAVLICCGYLFSTYLPELPALRSVVICLAAALLFSVPATFWGKPSLGWLCILLAVGISLFIPQAIREYELIPETIGIKSEIIYKQIFEFMPDYHAVYPFGGEVQITLMASAVAALYSYVFAHAFFRGNGYIFAILITVCNAAVCFVGIEREGAVYLLLSIALLCVLFCSSGGYAVVGKTARQLTAFSLTLIMLSGVFGMAYDRIGRTAAGLVRKTGIEELVSESEEQSGLFDDYATKAGESYGISLANRSYRGETHFYIESEGYGGVLYLASASYSDYSDGRWYARTNKISFSEDSPLIDATAVIDVIQIKNAIVLPYPLWSEGNPRRGTSVDKRGARHVVERHNGHIVTAPTSPEFLSRLSAAESAAGNIKDDNAPAEITSDVDFAKLAYEITDGRTASEMTLEDAVLAIKNFLSGMTYTLEPKSSPGYENYDRQHSAIYNFIYNTKEGYCVHYATTATLLLRSMGFKTRYTVGYCADVVRGAFSAVKDNNAHAWAEVFIDGNGWVPLEFTFGGVEDIPGYDATSRDAESSAPHEESIEAPSAVQSSEEPSYEESELSIAPVSTVSTESTEPAEKEKPFPTAAVLSVAGVLALIAAVVFTVRRLSARNAAIRHRFASGEGGCETVREEWRFVLGLLEQNGMTPAEGEEITAFARRVCDANPDMPCLTDVLPLYLAAEFGNIADETAVRHCGTYVLVLNDWTAQRLSTVRRLIAFAVARLLPASRKNFSVSH